MPRSLQSRRSARIYRLALSSAISWQRRKIRRMTSALCSRYTAAAAAAVLLPCSCFNRTIRNIIRCHRDVHGMNGRKDVPALLLSRHLWLPAVQINLYHRVSEDKNTPGTENRRWNEEMKKERRRGNGKWNFGGKSAQLTIGERRMEWTNEWIPGVRKVWRKTKESNEWIQRWGDRGMARRRGQTNK